MKTKIKNKVIILLLALLSLFVLAGCTFGQTLDEFIASENIKVKITYYVNEGTFEGTSTKRKDLYYHDGDMPLNITESPETADEGFEFGKGSIYISRDNYILVGWYYVTEVVDEKDGICELGEAFDFTKPLQGGDELIEIKLAAKWQKTEGLLVKLGQIVDEDLNVLAGETITAGQTYNAIAKDETTGEAITSFAAGDVLGEIFYKDDGTLSMAATQPNEMLFTVANNEYTFFEYYMDEACTTPVTWPVVQGEVQTTIYARYMKGNWTYVTDKAGVRSMFNSGLKKEENFFIKNDIDCTGISVNPLSEMKGVLVGNGRTISNLKVSATPSTKNLAMFGDIKATAKIKGVTFSNILMEYKRTALSGFNVEIYFVFLSLEEGATVENVTLQGTMLIDSTQSSWVTNMQDNRDHCLFGGYTTDAEYNGGFSVVGDVNEFITLGSKINN